MPRRGRVPGRVPAADQVEVRERSGPVALGDVVGGLSGPLVLVRLDLGQGPVEVLCAVHNAVSRGNSKHANRRAPPARRNTATCTLASLRRSRTLSVPAAETALLTGVTVPRPTDRAPTPISHIS